ncbi:MAG TPA: multidrug effflux MFS transporter [Allosphingosinicella sp.]|nr:multidrug effflux MFS transporter [Allosphingosinicella sp.]
MQATAAGRAPGRREFVLLIAALMASNALGIDAMLPALPAIGETLGVAEENRRQLVITFYMLGFGVAQLFYGPLADRFGRRNLLIGCMLGYAGFALLSGLAGSFGLLLAARTLHGVAAAGTRVLVVAVVRDRFEGSAMAQIMSTAMIIFMIAPILAPGLGQLLLQVGSWRWIFLALAIYALALSVWAAWRLPETLARAHRRPLSARHFGAAVKETLANRVSAGNTLAMTLTFGALLGFINSIQQVIFDVFQRPELIGIVFACIAGPMALSSWLNARLVMRFGSRRLLLTATAAFTGFASLHLALLFTTGETIWSFVAVQALTMGCFGLIGSNSGALAMEPLGHIAGTASALQGLLSTVGAALIGLLIGQLFDGTTLPLVAGFVICGTLALIISRWANAGLPDHARNELTEPVDSPLA